MVERICPACRHANPIENRYCGACGGALAPNALARRAEAPITVAGQPLPLAQLKQVGQAVALSLAAVAAEAGLAWLRRRVSGAPSAAPLANTQRSLAPRSADPVANVITIVSQRVVEVWEEGSLTRQVVEKHIWRKTSNE